MPILEAAGHHVLALDLLGCGYSDKPLVDSMNYTQRNQGELVSCAIASLGLTDVTLVGHSSGGVVAAAAAQVDPSRISGLVLISPGFYYTTALLKLFVWPLNVVLARMLSTVETRVAMFNKSHVDKAVVTPELIADFTQPTHTPGAIDAVGLMMLAREAPYPNLISGLVPAMPMLLVWGEEDTVNLPSAVEKIRMAASCVVQTVLVPRCGHYVQHESPELLAKAIVKFCRSTLTHRREVLHLFLGQTGVYSILVQYRLRNSPYKSGICCL